MDDVIRDDPDRDPPYHSVVRVAGGLVGAALAAAVIWRIINYTRRR